MLLQDKVAIVTGRGGFVARQVVLRLAREGALLSVSDKRADTAEDVGQMIRDAGFPVLCLAADTTVRTDVRRVVEQTVARYGRIDVLVNAAPINVSSRSFGRARKTGPGSTRRT